MGKNRYQETCDAISEKIKASNQARGRESSAVSKTDMEDMAHSLLNTPEHIVRQYSTKQTEDGTPEYEERQPVKRYRESLKPMLRGMGLDKHDVEKVNDAVITKEHASAMMEVGTTVIHDYIKAGRKFSMPITSEDEAKMEFACSLAPERESINRFAKDDTSVTVTKERSILKAKNSVPYWLKDKK